MIGGLVFALRTLTGIPVPGPNAKDTGSAVPWFPVVGFLIGLFLFGLTYVCSYYCTWHAGIAAIVVAAGVLITRALHLDGLADCADGFWGGYTKEDALRIMKDPSIGSFGALALIICLLIKWCAIVALLENGRAILLIAAFTASRYVQADLASVCSYARTDGGKAGAFFNNAKPIHGLIALVAASALLAAVYPCRPVYIGAIPAAWCIGRVLAMYCKTRLGGMTGDTLGAVSEIVETAILFGGAVAATII